MLGMAEESEDCVLADEPKEVSCFDGFEKCDALFWVERGD